MDELGRFLSEHEFDFVNPKHDYEWDKYKDDVEEITVDIEEDDGFEEW